MLLVSRTCATLAACSSQRARAPNVCVALSLLVSELSNGPWRGKPPRASAAALPRAQAAAPLTRRAPRASALAPPRALAATGERSSAVSGLVLTEEARS